MEETLPLEIEEPVAYREEKRRALMLMLATTVLLGLLTPLLGTRLPGQILLLLMTQVVAAFALTWLYFDSVEMERPIGTGMRIAIVLLGGIVIPYYFFRTRGFVSGLGWLFKIAGLYLALFLIFFIVAIIVTLIIPQAHSTLPG